MKHYRKTIICFLFLITFSFSLRPTASNNNREMKPNSITFQFILPVIAAYSRNFSDKFGISIGAGLIGAGKSALNGLSLTVMLPEVRLNGYSKEKNHFSLLFSVVNRSLFYLSSKHRTDYSNSLAFLFGYSHRKRDNNIVNFGIGPSLNLSYLFSGKKNILKSQLIPDLLFFTINWEFGVTF